MAGPQLVLVWPVGEGGSIPGFGGGIPAGGGDPGYDKPIHHPGHPEHGLPSRPAHPGGGPVIPGLPNLPSQGLPPGQPITINPPLPPPTGENANKVIIAVFRPGAGWTVTAYDPSLVAGTPLPPTGQPKA